MKNFMLFVFIAVVFSAFTGMQYPAQDFGSNPQEKLELGFPAEVMTVLERSCFDCHTDESGNMKAKGRLNFTKWAEYTPAKKIGKLDDICSTLKEGKMPKKGYLEKYPDKALTQDEINLICKWTEDEMEKLAGE